MRSVTHKERVDRFVEVLHAWYVLHRRELPWRDMWDLEEHDRAYRVWISEVMLQQTQVSRVIGAYKKFIQEFPTVHDLAKATNAEILVAWRGMGYNSRALRLRDGAKIVSERFDGKFPYDVQTLQTIKGIGAYTAGAIRTFAFDMATIAIDVNVRRILQRVFVGPEEPDGNWKTTDKQLSVIMFDVLNAWRDRQYRASDLLSALMDYGSLVQTKNNPKWEICVLSQAGIMKATPKNWVPPVRGAAKEKLRKEPGRYVGPTYIPNRIFRGRIVEALRDHPEGLNFEEIGAWISPDHREELHEWQDQLIKKLIQDGMLENNGKKFVLAR